MKGLGENLFDEAYTFLKDKLVRPADDDGGVDGEEDYEFDFAQMQQAMVRILGKDKIHFWDMIDELILVEEVRLAIDLFDETRLCTSDSTRTRDRHLCCIACRCVSPATE